MLIILVQFITLWNYIFVRINLKIEQKKQNFDTADKFSFKVAIFSKENIFNILACKDLVKTKTAQLKTNM